MAYDSTTNKRPRADSLSVVSLRADEPRPRLVSSASQDNFDYPRKRAVIACEVCRSRKSKCDGAKPRCRLCSELNADCVYREPGIKLDAGDRLILEHLGRIENLIQAKFIHPTSPTGPVNILSPATSNTTEGPHFDYNRLNGVGAWSSESISSIPRQHTTPALKLLQWPVIKDLVTRAYDPQALLDLEIARPPLKLPAFPRPDMNSIDVYVTAFFERVNVWYACVNPYSWRSYHRAAASVSFAHGLDSCLVLLVLALGTAAQGGSISSQPNGRQPLGIDYFACAWKLFPHLMFQNDMLAVKCHTLAAVYLFYLVRPLEAWNMLTNASSKLQLLLGAPDRLSPHVKEMSDRLYWNTLLVESDLLAELDLPHSGIVSLEENMDLPGPFRDTGDEPAGKEELWYFLAEIALRRILNRVTHLIYTKSLSRTATPKLERVVCELDFQLTQWYEGLPSPVKFPRSRQATASPIQTVLRLRYFACRTIMFRPYILIVLANENAAQDFAVQEHCRKCLEASIRQIENVKEHHAGHLPYLWQGVLSLVSQTLLIMGATMSPSLANLMPPASQIDVIIADVIVDIERMAHLAPSVKLGAEILREAEDKRRMFFKAGREHRRNSIVA